MTAYEALETRHQLEASLMAAREVLEQLEEQIPQLMHRKREADVAAVEASDSFRKLLRRLTGKEDPTYTLELAAKTAASELEQAQREKRSTEQHIAQLEQTYAALEPKEALLARLTDPEKEHFRRMDAGLHCEKALHLLGKSRKELEQAQYLARNPMMQVGQGYQENVHKQRAGDSADECRQQLQTIQALGFDIPIHAYLQNPMGYIVTARRYGDQDQMNSAQQGIRETEKSLKELLLQLAE